MLCAIHLFVLVFQHPHLSTNLFVCLSFCLGSIKFHKLQIKKLEESKLNMVFRSKFISFYTYCMQSSEGCGIAQMTLNRFLSFNEPLKGFFFISCKTYRPSTFCKVGDIVPLGGRSTGTGQVEKTENQDFYAFFSTFR